jgi:hypothetical protein
VFETENHKKKRKGKLMKLSKMLLPFAAFGLVFSGTAIAQDDDHGLITVRTTTVKTGKGPEYEELLAKLAAARKAAGHGGVTVWQVARGPASTYYTVTSAEKHADLGGPFDSGMSDGDWQRWISRITDVVDHSMMTTLRTHGELAIAAESGSAPNMAILRFSTVRPGTGGEHHEWLQERLRPALVEGNAGGWNVSNVTLGDDANTWVSSTRLDSWAQMDGPGPLSHLSERARENLLDDYYERVESIRVEVVRLMPELSY